MIYGNFESILVPEDNGKKNLNESYTSKYQKHEVRGYGHELVCVDDKLSKPFKSHLGKDVFYNFISNIIEESKYCSDVIEKKINKEIVMIKEDNGDFENFTKCWICDSDYVSKR